MSVFRIDRGIFSCVLVQVGCVVGEILRFASLEWICRLKPGLPLVWACLKTFGDVFECLCKVNIVSGRVCSAAETLRYIQEVDRVQVEKLVL
jgi:hypothetical protein